MSDLGLKWQKVIIFKVFTLVSQFKKKHIIGNNIYIFCLSNWLKIKVPFEELRILAFWGQNLGQSWVKMFNKSYFHTSQLTPNPIFSKDKVFNSHSLLTNQTVWFISHGIVCSYFSANLLLFTLLQIYITVMACFQDSSQIKRRGYIFMTGIVC